jgi:hypothetical protein
MNLSEVFQTMENKTDKGTIHDYIDGYYSNEFTPKKDNNLNLLEIGVNRGYSIELWREFFNQILIVGLDNIKEYNEQHTNVLYRITDAYTESELEFYEDGIFDYIIDDGPHSVQTQLFSINHYYNKLKQFGKLIIEDIQTDNDLRTLISRCKELNYEHKVFDLRLNKGRYDDIILEITKK